MTYPVTTDLSEFGFHEMKEAVALLTAYTKNPPDWLGAGVHLRMNKSSGYVFLSDDDFNVALEIDGKLEAFLSTPSEGLEGVIEDLTDDYTPDELDDDDVEFIVSWAELLKFDLPETWADAA